MGSFGSKGQWNPVHYHGASIFTQVKGSKGWSMGSPDFFDKSVWENPRHPRNIQGLWEKDVCSRFAKRQSARHLGTLVSLTGSAASNWTSNGRFCTIKEGESMFVPRDWWHGTCDLTAWSAGFANFLE